MALKVVTGPTVEPVTLTEAKAHLRLDIPDDDGLLAGYLLAARNWVEGQTKRVLSPTTFDYYIDYGFPWRRGYRIVLPVNPVISVASVSYVDDAGNTATWATDQWTAVCRDSGSYIVPAYNVSLPVIRNVPNAITVRFTAGYLDDSVSPQVVSQPWELKTAVMLLAGAWYEDREQGRVPDGVEALISPHRDCRP